MANSLPERLLQLASFRRYFRTLTVRSVARQFDGLHLAEQLATPPLNYLLECASVMAHSQHGPCQDAALRVAQYCLTDDSSTDTQRDAAAFLLDSMTNMSAVALAVARSHLRPHYVTRLPTTLRLDCFRRE